MYKNKRNRQGIFPVIIIIVISFLTFSLSSRSDKNLLVESIVVSIVAPVQNGVMYLTRGVRDIFFKYFYLVGLEEKSRFLEKKNQELIFQNDLLQEKILKYKRLEILYNATQSSNRLKLVSANVIGFDSTGWSKLILIDKGSKDSLEKNMAVITHLGLVGKIVSVMENNSKILLITDTNSSVDALVQRNRVRGVISGTNEDFCEMKYVSINSDISVGDKIISSGQGGTIQKGLTIGTVSNITKDNSGLFKEVKIIPASDLKRLEEVFILLNSFEEKSDTIQSNEKVIE